MKRNLTIIAALFVAFVVGTIGKAYVEKSLTHDNSQPVDFKTLGFLSEIASKANKVLPIMIDDITEHRSVIPQQGEIIHQYRLVKNVKEDFELVEVDVKRSRKSDIKRTERISVRKLTKT